MIWHPQIDQHVRIHYAAKYADEMPFHGRTGVVERVSAGPGPINASIRLDGGAIVTVPRGNLIADPRRKLT